MYTFYFGAKFKKDYKKIKQNPNFKEKELKCVFNILKQGKVLDEKFQNHKLLGDYKDCCECHIRSDILLIYKINKEELRIELIS